MPRRATLLRLHAWQQLLWTLAAVAGGWFGAVTTYSRTLSEVQHRQAALYQLVSAVAVKLGITSEYIAAITPVAAPDNR